MTTQNELLKQVDDLGATAMQWKIRAEKAEALLREGLDALPDREGGWAFHGRIAAFFKGQDQ